MSWWRMDITFSDIVIIHIVQRCLFCGEVTVTVRTAACGTCGSYSPYFFCVEHDDWISHKKKTKKKNETLYIPAVLVLFFSRSEIMLCYTKGHISADSQAAWYTQRTQTHFLYTSSPLSSTSITRMYRQLISDSCLITQSYIQTHIVSLSATWHEAAAHDSVSPSHSFARTNSQTFCIIRGRPCPCWYRFIFMWLVIWAFLARPGLPSSLNGPRCALPLFPELSLCLARHYDYSRACGGLVAFVLRRHWSTGSPHTCPHTHQHTQKAVQSLKRWSMTDGS